MRELRRAVDFCVVGGGPAGLCAAVAAARRGARVVLMHDRPMLGGNASSEIRMWICGAHGSNNRETGLLEELMLENCYRNPGWNYSIWDSILYELARREPNLTLLLNCACNALGMEDERITWVRGWQTTTQTWHTVEAPLFADCSGDSVLAPLCGADFRVGREAASEFDEDIEPTEADGKTMGMSLLLQAREMLTPQSYIPPSWANVYPSDENLPHREHALPQANFWWMELGGEENAIADTESLRDELLKIAFGVWDHIKNRGEHGAENWALDWVGFLPGKRESRRYLGDHILTQGDVRAEGRFPDLVAYGGWTMDDHHPAGMHYPGEPTIWHPAPSPFGIPYRCLYSRKVPNLWMAGRNISTTHAALSATRVMATCALCGQAVGVAAAIAAHHGLTPRQVGQQRLAELQQALLDDDCYLPWHTRAVPALAQCATLTASAGDPEPLRNGHDRPIGGDDNGWTAPLGTWVAYTWPEAQLIREARLVCDSDLNRPGHNMPSNYPLALAANHPPATLLNTYRLEVLDDLGAWRTLWRQQDNHQRLVRTPLDVRTRSIRLVTESTWGAPMAHLFAFDVR